MRTLSLLGLFAWLLLTLAGCAAPAATSQPSVADARVTPPPPTATPTSSPTVTPTASPTATPIPTATPTPTITPTITPTPSPTPGPTPDGQLRTARVPILMYHYISTPPPGADDYRIKLSLAPDIFRAHLDYLQEQGYVTMRLVDLIAYLETGQPELPPKPIILTFDDGYRDNYENAFPALRDRGLIGTFFIITDFADLAATDPNYAVYATWDELREMDAAGMELGSHSRNHPDLKGKDVDFLVWQALGSSQTLEANLGKKPRVLAYPFGSYDNQVIDVFRSAGFWGAVTTQPGVEHRSDAVFEITRLRISNETGVVELAELLHFWEEE